MTPLEPVEKTPYSKVIARAITAYLELTPKVVSEWIGEEYTADHVVFDPVAAYLETEFPGLNVRTGLTHVLFLDGASSDCIKVLEWHDLLLAKVTNGMTSRDGDLHGYRNNVDGETGATVETLQKLLAPRPVCVVVRIARTVSSALKTAFKRNP